MSAYAALNGTPVTRARIVLPLTGIWHADVWLDRVVDVSGSQTLAVGPWSGTCSVLRAIDFAGQRMLRLVGGAGKWPSIPTTPLFWAGAQLSTILGDVASAVGEQVNVVSDRTVSPFYVMDGATPASTVLQDLAGDGWWMDLAGVTQIGTRPTPTIASPFTLRDVDGPPGVYHVETEALNDWVPGASFSCPTGSGVVSRVDHVLEAGHVRTEVMVPLVSTAPTDRLRDAIRAILGQMLPNWRELGTWEYTVVSASGGPSNVTVDAKAPEGSGMPDVTGLPLRADSSGSVALPVAGSKVLVGWCDVARTQPEVRGLDGSTAPTTVWLGQGTMPLARLGDQVQVFAPPGLPIVTSTGPATLILAAPLSGVITQGSPILNGP